MLYNLPYRKVHLFYWLKLPVTPRLEREDLGKQAVVGWIGQYSGISVEKRMKSSTSHVQYGHIPNRNYKHAFPKQSSEKQVEPILLGDWVLSKGLWLPINYLSLTDPGEEASPFLLAWMWWQMHCPNRCVFFSNARRRTMPRNLAILNLILRIEVVFFAVKRRPKIWRNISWRKHRKVGL